MDRIIEQLLAPDTAIIQKATKEYDEAIKRPQAIEDMCNILANHEKPDVRQYAAVLLRKQLTKLRNYQQVSTSTQSNIKASMLNIIFNEKENFVRGAITQFFGCILRHESRTDEVWVGEVIQYIVAQCSSNDPQAIEVGSFVLAKLADETPEPFVQRFSNVGGLIKAALMSAENNISAVPTTVLYNILTTMGAIVPVILGNNEAENTYQSAVPILVKIINQFAEEALLAHFKIALEVLENMAECTPLLLNCHLRLLLEFSLAISSNAKNDSDIRIKSLNFVCFMVREKKKLVVKLKLIEAIITVVFNIMASEPESDDADEFFVESDSDTTLAAANVAMDTMAVSMPPEKFIPPLLALLEPALQNPNDELRRRAAYIVLATISEGCREAICNKYLEPMLNILKQGLNDPASSVRSAALFAVGQFSEQLQPEIVEYANDVLPLLLKYMHDILLAHQSGQQLEEKHVERVFYALEAFCESMEEALAPFMENLMTMILTLLNNNVPQRLQVLAMALTEAAAKAFKGSLLPWFQPLIEKLKPMILQVDQNDVDGLRSQSLNTLAALARNIDEQFRPFAYETMQQCVQWIETSNDPDVRRAVLNVFGAIGSIVGEELALVLPTVLNHIERCMDEGSDLPPQLLAAAAARKGAGDGDAKNGHEAGNDNDDDEIDLDVTSDEESESGEHYLGDNPYLQLKEQAVYTLKEIAESCPRAMLNYNQKLFESLYKIIEHVFIDVRRGSISASKSLVIKWFEQEPLNENAKQAVHILMPKLVDIVRKDNSSDVVIEALESIGDIMAALGKNSLPTKQLCDSIAQCIKDGLNYKYMCQFGGDTDDTVDSEDDSESDKAVIEGAANLLAFLGKAVSTEEYVIYFKLLEPLVIKHIQNATAGDLQSTRAFLIGVLAESYTALGIHVEPYFAKHFNILINAAKERNAKTRQNAIFGVGELVRAGRDVSYGFFPTILETLSGIVAIEKKRVIVDNIIGALARLILTNANLVPLDQVLPAMLEKLPIVDDEVECNVVIECFNMLYNIMPERMHPHVNAVVAIAIQTITKGESEQERIDAVVNLLHQIRTLYPVDYQQALTNPTLNSLLTIAQEQTGGRL